MRIAFGNTSRELIRSQASFLEVVLFRVSLRLWPNHLVPTKRVLLPAAAATRATIRFVMFFSDGAHKQVVLT